MRVKARPDLHYAPIDNGLYVSGSLGELALRGSELLHEAFDSCYPLLLAGTDDDQLVDHLGGESTRRVVTTLLTRLLAKGMLLDLETLTVPEPTTTVRDRHPEALAYLECHSDDPYAAFQRLQANSVVVVGKKEHVTCSLYALRASGIGRVIHRPADEAGPTQRADAAVVVLGPDEVGTWDQLRSRLDARVVVPVVVSDRLALSGPAVRDEPSARRWAALWRRAQECAGSRGERLGRADLATSIASSLAAHLVVATSIGLSSGEAQIVHGKRLLTDKVDLDSVWGHDQAGSISTVAADITSTADPVADGLTTMLHRWVGIADPVDDDDVLQMPVAVRRARDRRSGALVAGHGPDQRGAAESLALALARRTSAHGAAGTTRSRWLLEGALRALAPYARRRAAPELSAETGRLVSALHATATDEVTWSVSGIQGIGWSLAQVGYDAGRTAAAWGPTPDAATSAAAQAALACITVPPGGARPHPPVSTDALMSADDPTVGRLVGEVVTAAARMGMVAVGQRARPDAVLGELPCWSGPVVLVPRPPGRGRSTSSSAGETNALEAAVATLSGLTGARVQVRDGWQPVAEREELKAAAREGAATISIRVYPHEIQIGPLWSPDASLGCAGCAEVRSRATLDHPLLGEPTAATHRGGAASPVLKSLTAQMVDTLRTEPLRPGELVLVSTGSVTRHQITRSTWCPCCGPTDLRASADRPPPPLPLDDGPSRSDDPGRVAASTRLLDESHLREEVTDPRFGPVRAVVKESRAPFAMSMALLSGAPVPGHGRSLSFRSTRAVAVLEAYERHGSFPFDTPVLVDTALRELTGRALDPGRLGRYSSAQLAHPSSRVQPWSATTPIDWVWAHDLASREVLLLPADVGFYQYDYNFKHDALASRAAPREQRRRCFLESSSGCAVGSTLTEATIHALFEVAERDAFQLAWHRRSPLPHVPVGSVDDPVVRSLTALLTARGYVPHLLVATQDIDVPVVWVMAVHASGGFPAVYCSAGSGLDPVAAVRNGLREVAQLVCQPVGWTREEADQLVRDPWLVTELDHHLQRGTSPDALPRFAEVFGGDEVTLDDAFADTVSRLRRRSAGRIRGCLDALHESFAEAGLEQILLVDQSSREHRDQGIRVVKAVVPGTVPMCFGSAHQRLLGIPRLDRHLAAVHAGATAAVLDPHPFP